MFDRFRKTPSPLRPGEACILEQIKALADVKVRTVFDLTLHRHAKKLAKNSAAAEKVGQIMGAHLEPEMDHGLCSRILMVLKEHPDSAKAARASLIALILNDQVHVDLRYGATDALARSASPQDFDAIVDLVRNSRHDNAIVPLLSFVFEVQPDSSDPTLEGLLGNKSIRSELDNYRHLQQAKL